ncbi:N, N'-diacetylbacillosaminyl-diphospho-undecaprenol alpha-1,3-N-acetylgalactosaminyltransferase [Methylobacterium dankookense]|uniref:N, N'-diacetylbacillosaminyl-diphospho-undecaprenol alpha-1,3-N-acetylgalactosaminyltransferase n=2 Tax=Methylobacterium dankookense TaxID=560405 RepID=A0A564FWQ0_9HYPH|nr:N, N'-diacetylbacillosaminyl-diphospho-undecaprenol alpha-1,3-N-acetylgalactosaminyltransferase [Methylobacterium dankookense]VUF11841.1 N, N'-diacetylbacillosaminyl-diphospho-undecaprenol alpha-1,3-N-acetylgalactosaminyltransferase [Methylobacterium dankookense]
MDAPLPAQMAEPMARLVYVVTEDWFFASHFLPFARAAVAMGLSVTVVTRVRDHRAAIEATGARVVPLEAERSSLNPMAAGYAAGQLAAILKALKADIVHCIALRGILVGGTAATMAGVPARVYALTGLGLIGARQDAAGRMARTALRHLIRGALASRRTRFLLENPDDARALGLDPADTAVTIVGGAGVDPEAFRPAPLPPLPPLRVALVARMLWSKGVDVAVEAVRLARARGVPVELSLYGAPDPSNRRAIPEETLRGWSRDGVAWHGPTRDVAQVYGAHHVACLPSRGGEGLPRTLLEGAACGRALLTTDVPGCRTLVRDGVEGLVVPPDDAEALARALARLAADPALVAGLGEGARARILAGGFTEAAVAEAVCNLYRELMPA